MRTCPRCHAEVDVDARFCYNCGLVLGPAYTGQSSASDPDRRAVAKLWNASTIYSIGTAFEILYAVLIYGFKFPLLGVLSISLSVIGTTIELVAVVLLASTFRTLAKIDNHGFSMAATMSIFFCIALPIFLAVSTFETYSLSGSATTPFSVAALSQLLAASALLSVPDILAIVGYVGIIIGLWRVGVRYGERAVRIWAVLFIIPYVSIVGALLTVVALGKMRSGAANSETPLPFRSGNHDLSLYRPVLQVYGYVYRVGGPSNERTSR